MKILLKSNQHMSPLLFKWHLKYYKSNQYTPLNYQSTSVSIKLIIQKTTVLRVDVDTYLSLLSPVDNFWPRKWTAWGSWFWKITCDTKQYYLYAEIFLYFWCYRKEKQRTVLLVAWKFSVSPEFILPLKRSLSPSCPADL